MMKKMETILNPMQSRILLQSQLTEHKSWLTKGDPEAPGRLYLHDSSFSKDDWYGKDLTAIRMENCEAVGISARVLRLRRTDLLKCDFSTSDFSMASFEAAQIRRCNFAGAQLSSTVWDQAQVQGCIFLAASFHLTTAHQSRFSLCNFKNAELGGLRVEDARFENCDFLHADFKGARIEGATFSHCDLRYVRLERSTWTNVRFEHCKFYGSRGPAKEMEGLQAIGSDLSAEGNDSFKGSTADLVELWSPR